MRQVELENTQTEGKTQKFCHTKNFESPSNMTKQKKSITIKEKVADNLYKTKNKIIKQLLQMPNKLIVNHVSINQFTRIGFQQQSI
ncbi:unnamed protein product [Paramecium pentaurelia]|uniref:Uncharacterized protein n=1 Tax=Paramecium pentaurelia TaxID=43138 RepID=A0A8S1WRR4_9CILI|nr:unnamed protein product [Paramecium pentaurelia]